MSKKTNGSQNNQTAHWKLVERVVAALEYAIAPGARVEHNGWLIDQESGVKRQCDVLIHQGHPPRETVTIVEVQDRSRRVTLPTFEGWCRKREKVRAQHLICVSQKGFSRSVVAEANRQGNVVRLLELRELEESVSPLKFRQGKMSFIWPEYTIDSYSVKTVDNKLPGSKFKRGDVNFHRNGVEVQIGQVFAEFFPSIGCPHGEGEFNHDQRIAFGKDDVLIMSWDADSVRVDTLTAHLKVKCRRIALSMVTSEYKQINYENSLAWSIAGTGELEGREGAINFVFVPQPDGMLRPIIAQGFGLLDNLNGEISFQYSQD